MPALFIGLRKTVSGLFVAIAVFLAARYLLIAAFEWLEVDPQFGFKPGFVRIVQALDAIIAVLVSSSALTILLTASGALFLALYLMVSWCKSVAAPGSAKTALPINLIVSGIVTALFFSSTINELFRFFVNLVEVVISAGRELFERELPNQLRCIGQPEFYRSERIGEPECLINALSGFAQIVASAGTDAIRPFNYTSFSFVTILVAVAFFILLGLTIRRVQENFDGPGYFWLGYGVIAAFSLYLSLTAILAVPLLTIDESAETPRPGSELQDTLTEMLPTTIMVARETPIVDPIEELLEDRFPDEDALDGAASAAQDLFYVVQAKEIDRKVTGLVFDVERLRAEFQQRLVAQLGSAVDRYSVELSTSRGNKEAAEHFLSLRDWFQSVVERAASSYARCLRSVESTRAQHVNLSSQLDTLGRSYAGPENLSRLIEELNDRRIRDELGSLESDIRSSERACTFSDGRYVPPQREDFGTSLGFAGFATGWLLSSENLQVALITGLLGFGLLGALLSLFVRLQIDAQKDVSTTSSIRSAGVDEICIVVFVGFGAALVVYLFSYGGLEIIGTGESNDPNPYIVFATAFAGATFSKSIWKRARNLVADED